MSKHVWRSEVINANTGELRASTIVDDTACFPVREAMRLCQLVDKQDNSFDGIAELGLALTAYRYAVARMKAKKGKR